MPAKPVPAPYDDSLSLLRAVILDGAAPGAPSSLETNVIVAEILDAAALGGFGNSDSGIEFA